MTEEFQLNDDTYTGTKEVSENLKFESKFLQEWINDYVKAVSYTHLTLPTSDLV